MKKNFFLFFTLLSLLLISIKTDVDDAVAEESLGEVDKGEIEGTNIDGEIENVESQEDAPDSGEDAANGGENEVEIEAENMMGNEGEGVPTADGENEADIGGEDEPTAEGENDPANGGENEPGDEGDETEINDIINENEDPENLGPYDPSGKKIIPLANINTGLTGCNYLTGFAFFIIGDNANLMNTAVIKLDTYIKDNDKEDTKQASCVRYPLDKVIYCHLNVHFSKDTIIIIKNNNEGYLNEGTDPLYAIIVGEEEGVIYGADGKGVKVTLEDVCSYEPKFNGLPEGNGGNQGGNGNNGNQGGNGDDGNNGNQGGNGDDDNNGNNGNQGGSGNNGNDDNNGNNDNDDNNGNNDNQGGNGNNGNQGGNGDDDNDGKNGNQGGNDEDNDEYEYNRFQKLDFLNGKKRGEGKPNKLDVKNFRMGGMKRPRIVGGFINIQTSIMIFGNYAYLPPYNIGLLFFFMIIVFSTRGRRRRLDDNTNMMCENSDSVPNTDKAQADVGFDCNSEDNTYSEDYLNDKDAKLTSLGGEEPPSYLKDQNLSELPEEEFQTLMTSIKTTAQESITSTCEKNEENSEPQSELKFKIGELETADSTTDYTFNLPVNISHGSSINSSSAVCSVVKGEKDINCSLALTSLNISEGDTISYSDQDVAVEELTDNLLSIVGGSFSSVECPFYINGSNLEDVEKIQSVKMSKPKLEGGKLTFLILNIIKVSKDKKKGEIYYPNHIKISYDKRRRLQGTEVGIDTRCINNEYISAGSEDTEKFTCTSESIDNNVLTDAQLKNAKITNENISSNPVSIDDLPESNKLDENINTLEANGIVGKSFCSSNNLEFTSTGNVADNTSLKLNFISPESKDNVACKVESNKLTCEYDPCNKSGNIKFTPAIYTSGDNEYNPIINKISSTDNINLNCDSDSSGGKIISKSSGLSGGAIAGIIVALAVALIGGITAAILCKKNNGGVINQNTTSDSMVIDSKPIYY